MFSIENMFQNYQGMEGLGLRESFKVTYRCYSISMFPGPERQDVERGGKIMMPPSALDKLARLNIQYPMLFKLVNKKTNRETHCGVLEFVADEGRIYIPYWMTCNLLLDEEGGLVQLESVSLPIATFAKFQPQNVDFLEITNPKAVLENALRNFACLTTGDMIAIKYNDKAYELCVLEAKPGKAVSIIECDLNVDFAAPIGYKEPLPSNVVTDSVDEDMSTEMSDYIDPGFKAFAGSGNRLDGKKRDKENTSEKPVAPQELVRGIPNYDFKKGKLTFIRTQRQIQNGDSKEGNSFEAFAGSGQSLRKKVTRK
ncbi:ubiquitin recognition factor in ER-associated degradation protein 1-like [Lineus longissimus]|uniref:ubiquitin recognition factor in ER-associated degradation protein 1-like n=1 Tax=Lineus longissimus TaxID=88925 RepID=UPI002B4E5287